MIAAWDQVTLRDRRNRRPRCRAGAARPTTVLRLLGIVPADVLDRGRRGASSASLQEATTEPRFAPGEKAVVRHVLALADRQLQTVLSATGFGSPGSMQTIPRGRVVGSSRWRPSSSFLVSHGSMDDVVGFPPHGGRPVPLSEMTKTKTWCARMQNPERSRGRVDSRYARYI